MVERGEQFLYKELEGSRNSIERSHGLHLPRFPQLGDSTPKFRWRGGHYKRLLSFITTAYSGGNYYAETTGGDERSEEAEEKKAKKGRSHSLRRRRGAAGTKEAPSERSSRTPATGVVRSHGGGEQDGRGRREILHNLDNMSPCTHLPTYSTPSLSTQYPSLKTLDVFTPIPLI